VDSFVEREGRGGKEDLSRPGMKYSCDI
jgi:hypothetical protein